MAVIYADNATHIGDKEEAVNARYSQLKSSLESQGLSVHEENEAGLMREPLGVRVDGWSGVVRPTQHRLWRLTLALRACRSGWALRGRDLERLVGHITFVLLLFRLSLSLLDHSYVFTRRFGLQRAALWPCVADELWRIRCVLPLVQTDLTLPWHDKGWMFDACLSGYAVMEGDLTQHETQQVGRWAERWRFKWDTSGCNAPRVKGLALLTRFRTWPRPDPSRTGKSPRRLSPTWTSPRCPRRSRTLPGGICFGRPPWCSGTHSC